MLSLNKKNTQERGELGFLKKLFLHNNYKQKKKKNKKIELENSNLSFIVVRHFHAYVHSPQSPNRVRVLLV